MKRLLLLVLSFPLALSALADNGKINFDFDWQFRLGDSKNYVDVQLPHDWNTTTDFDKSFRGDAGWQRGGKGEYRKTFTVSKSWQGKDVSVIFDGAYMDCSVSLNGKKVGSHFYGFTPFTINLTKDLKYGAKNEIVVTVNHDGYARWYTGSGINRHVWLRVVNPVHVKTNGTAITTPVIAADKATVKVVTEVENATSNTKVLQIIKDANGKAVAKSDAASVYADGRVTQEIALKNPHLWDIADPFRYTIETQVKVDGKTVDKYTCKFGVRTIKFEPQKGFWLNGKNIKLQGMCVHQDAGIFGSAIPDEMQVRRYSILKEFGVNAIRCSHNPPPTEMLDVCDSLGLLVIDEAFDKWTTGYYASHFESDWRADITAMVERDRNHPCVILWSIGNELAEMKMKDNTGVDRAHMIRDFVKSLDPSRLTACAMQPGFHDNFLSATDVIGFNYGEPTLLDRKQKNPELMGFISESYPYYSVFRVNESRDYSSKNPWNYVKDNDAIIGSFMWTGIEYWGESSGWPSKGWPGAIFDMAMKEKPFGAYFRAMWKPSEPVLRLCVLDYSTDLDPGKDHWQIPPFVHDWTFPYKDERVLPIYTPTNCDSVYLVDPRGKVYGPRYPKDYENSTIIWNQPYRKGTIKVIGYKDGKAAVTDSIVSTGTVVKDFTLTKDGESLKPTGTDYAFVEVQLLDENGLPIRVDDRKVTATVTGSATVCGINSLEMRRSEKMNSNTVPTKFGTCQIVVKSQRKPGDIMLKVNVDGIGEKEIRL